MIIFLLNISISSPSLRATEPWRLHPGTTDVNKEGLRYPSLPVKADLLLSILCVGFPQDFS